MDFRIRTAIGMVLVTLSYLSSAQGPAQQPWPDVTLTTRDYTGNVPATDRYHYPVGHPAVEKVTDERGHPCGLHPWFQHPTQCRLAERQRLRAQRHGDVAGSTIARAWPEQQPGRAVHQSQCQWLALRVYGR